MIKEFVNYLNKIKGYADNTGKAYEKDLHSFVLFVKANCTHQRWSEITRDDVDLYIAWQVERGLKPMTTNRHLSAISSLYDYMKRQGYQVENPARYESRRKVGDRIPNTIPTNVLRKAMETSQGTIHLMLCTLCQTGVRLQEMLDIRKCDLDIMNNAIRIQGKGMKERLVYVNEELMSKLCTFSTYRKAMEPIFKGWSQREVRTSLYEILRPLGTAPQLSPHAIRHTFATEVAKQGSNVTTLAVMMGHKSIKTTQKYIDLAQNNISSTYTRYHSEIA